MLATLTSALRSGLAAAKGADDPALAAARVRFVRKTAYGYGFVVRDRGTVSLPRGTTAAWTSVALSWVIAVNPLRFIVTLPRSRSFGSNYNRGAPTGPCPAFVLADDQVERTITTTKTPRLRFGEPPGRFRELRGDRVIALTNRSIRLP